MSPAVKSAVLVFVCATAAAGCASTCPAPAAQTTPVSTTRLTSADMAETDFAPLVGKPQHSTVTTTDEETSKDQRPVERHPGGGFSGYK